MGVIMSFNYVLVVIIKVLKHKEVCVYANLLVGGIKKNFNKILAHSCYNILCWFMSLT